MSYATSLTAALRTAVSASKAALPRAPGKGGKSRKRSKTQDQDEVPAPIATPSPSTQAKQSNWGLLEPVRSLLGPVADIIDSLFTPQAVITILGVLLIYSWFFRGSSTAVGPNQWSTAQRQVAYDEIWQHEESELWNWLEERVALDRAHVSVSDARVRSDDKKQEHISPDTMKEREVDEAIRVTEQKLKALKDSVFRERSMSRTKSIREAQT